MPQRKVNKRYTLPFLTRTKFDDVDFLEPQEIIETIDHLLEGDSINTKRKLLHLGLAIIGRLDPFVYELEDRLELLRVAQNASVLEFENIPSVNHQIAMFSKTLLFQCRPTTVDLNADIIRAFTSFFTSVNSSEQVGLYKTLGNILNKDIYKQSSSFPPVSSLDLSSLLKWSTKDVVNQTDARLVSFLDEATKVSSNHKEETETQRHNSIYNAIENILKARNQKCVSPPGLSLLTLIYVFGGRSRLICNMVSSTGAKGKYNLVKDCVLQNSKLSSARECKDGVEVYYSFDNAQKLFAIHRLYSQNQNKAIARVVTLLMKCYTS